MKTNRMTCTLLKKDDTAVRKRFHRDQPLLRPARPYECPVLSVGECERRFYL